MKEVKGYKHRIKNAYKDDDGYWIILNKNWKCPDGYYGERTIHEESWKETIAILKKTRFVLEG